MSGQVSKQKEVSAAPHAPSIDDAPTYVQELARAHAALRSRRAADPAWLDALRERRFAAFAAAGYPTRRDEDWKYTSLRGLASRTFSTRAAGDLSPPENPLGVGDRVVLAFVDGHFAPEASELGSLPEGVTARSLSELIREDESASQALLETSEDDPHPFRALAAAFAEDGLVLEVDADCEVEPVIQLLHWSTSAEEDEDGVLSAPHHWIRLGTHARATVVETYCGAAGSTLTIPVVDVEVGPGARLDHIKLQVDAGQAHHVALPTVRVGADAEYHGFTYAGGCTLAREQPTAMLVGSGAHVTLDALYVVSDGNHWDHHTSLEHAVPHCTSHQLYKGILMGQGHGVFNGKIHVAPKAQLTNADQLNQNLVLSPDARIDTKPELTIYADDVRCTHGATIGGVDRNELFYCMSRGLGHERARRMLVRAFGVDALGTVSSEIARGAVIDLLEQRLDALFDEEA